MYKSSILIVALVSGVYASENPFAIEKNVQKIEQEESALLQAIAKEQKTLESKKMVKSIKEYTTGVKTEESAVSPETEAVQEPEAEETKNETEKSKTVEAAPPETKKVESAVTPIEEAAKKSEIQEIKKEVQESKPKEETKESIAPLTIREVTKKTEAETVEKPAATKVESSVEKQIEKVDAEIKKLEEKLEASKTKTAIVDEVSVQPAVEANGSAESNNTFQQELQEAIKSVQD